MPEILLKVNEVRRVFGSLVAVDGLSFEIEKGDIYGIAGPNGSGKTTLMNLITQVFRPNAGEIFFKGKPIHKLSSHQICHLGIARTFQQTIVFGTMSIMDNMLAGATFGRNMNATYKSQEKMRELLRFVELDKPEDGIVGKLILSDRKKLMIAVALATEPELLILDEPCAGLTTAESKDVIDMIQKIHDRGITVMIIEHNMPVLMNISSKVMIIDHGTKLSEGTPEDVSNDPAVIEKYLGNTCSTPEVIS